MRRGWQKIHLWYKSFQLLAFSITLLTEYLKPWATFIYNVLWPLFFIHHSGINSFYYCWPIKIIIQYHTHTTADVLTFDCKWWAEWMLSGKFSHHIIHILSKFGYLSVCVFFFTLEFDSHWVTVNANGIMVLRSKVMMISLDTRPWKKQCISFIYSVIRWLLTLFALINVNPSTKYISYEISDTKQNAKARNSKDARK